MRADSPVRSCKTIVTVWMLGLVCGLVGISQPAFPANRALLVGIEAYPKPIKPLRGIRDDVDLVAKVLIETKAFSRDQIKTLIDRDATKANIVRWFKQWLIGATKPGDTALFYFSGHGDQIWDENGDETQDGIDEVLVCYDSRMYARKVRRIFRGQPASAYIAEKGKNLFVDDELRDLLKGLKGRRVVFISDSCHSGTVYKNLDPNFVQIKTPDDQARYKSVFEPRQSERAIDKSRRESTNIGADLRVPGIALIAMTASEDSQPAQVVRFKVAPKGYHSVFTWFFYHGLKGKGDLNRDGTVTFEELAEFTRRGIKRAGFAQIPQHEFTPRSLGSLSFAAPRRPSPTIRLTRPIRIACLVQGSGVSKNDFKRLKAELTARLPIIHWTTEARKASCRIQVEKRNRVYGARLTDSTGTYWETHEGNSLVDVAAKLAGNVRSSYIMSCLSVLRNPSRPLRFAWNGKLYGKNQVTADKVVQGDAVVFEAKTVTPGYLYLFNVGVRGVIHPLYPAPNAPPKRIKPGAPLVMGADGGFLVDAPFGKEMLVALMLNRPSASLDALWASDHIGSVDLTSFAPQERFLKTIWTELTSGGRPKGAWTMRTQLITSFRK